MLASTLARIAPHGAHIGARGEPGWRTTHELAGPRLDDALAHAAAEFGTDRADIAGQRLIELLTWRIAVPAAAALLAESRLPDLTPANTLVWIANDPPEGIGTALRTPAFHALPDDPDAPRATVHAGEGALVDELEHMLQAHMDVLAPAVHAATLRPETALARAATDRLVAALVWVGESMGRRERAIELSHSAHDAAELRIFRDALLHVRDGCCLYYRVPGGTKCWSCPLLTDADRRALAAGGG